MARSEIDWGLTWLSWRQRLGSVLRRPGLFLATVPERLRRALGRAPDPVVVSLYWSETKRSWLVRPVCYDPVGPSFEHPDRAFEVPGEASPEELTAALLRGLEASSFESAPELPYAEDWTRFVREHRLIHVSRTGDRLELAVNVRVHQGRGGAYVPAESEPRGLAAPPEPRALATAVEEALAQCRALERDW